MAESGGARAGRTVLLFAAASLATRGPFLWIDIINVDEAAHAVGSWELMAGRLLYTDFADHKPPLIYVYYALAQWLMGRGMLAVRLLTTLVTLPLTALAASAFHGHGRAGLAAGLLYLAYGAAFLAQDGQAVNGEVVMLLPAAWALALVRDGERAQRPANAAASGALLALSALVKPQGAFWGLAVALALWRAGGGRRRWVALAALAAGFALPLALTTAAFAIAGNLGDVYYWNVTHNLGYTANPIQAGDALRRVLRFLLPFLVVTAPLWWAAWRGRPLLAPPARLLALGALAATVPAVLLGLRLFPHYFIQLVLPLALAAAPVAAEWGREPARRAGRAALAWTMLMVTGFTAANLALFGRRGDAAETTRPVFGRVAERLRRDPCFADARLFVWGFAPGFYYHSGLRPASRFVVPATTVSGYVPGNDRLSRGEGQRMIRDDHWRLLIADLERSQATFVLDTAGSGLHRWRDRPAHGFPHLRALLQRDYEVVDTVDGVTVYRRRTCEAQVRVQ